MKEMSPETLLASMRGKVEEESSGCWRWTGKEGLALGVFTPGELMYAIARGAIGRGALMSRCGANEWCVNPWHRGVEYVVAGLKRTRCKWGHELNASGKCNECARLAMARWRAKRRACGVWVELKL
jgi:hypothetical protein